MKGRDFDRSLCHCLDHDTPPDHALPTFERRAGVCDAILLAIRMQMYPKPLFVSLLIIPGRDNIDLVLTRGELDPNLSSMLGIIPGQRTVLRPRERLLVFLTDIQQRGKIPRTDLQGSTRG
ncbi:hypothetical protein MLD38_018110 [Melastoma candidum]|uniref:Uncharacterized protein n=1 Tax=Melastoma candidum TaxID=119954 RepID=A0ACB9QVY3_9MYRT|nr:hypothetical protein MLD38_018110 [Melastoma candidum]